MNNNKFSLIVGAFSAVVGIIIGLVIALGAVGEGYGFFPAHAALSGFICGYFTSLFILDKPKQYNAGRIIISGIISGTASHWMCWYFFTIQMNFEYHVLKLEATTPPMNLFEALYLVLAFCFFSLIIAGWATVGGAIGAGFIAKKMAKV